jgi:Flp pilus assembly protein TadD
MREDGIMRLGFAALPKLGKDWVFARSKARVDALFASNAIQRQEPTMIVRRMTAQISLALCLAASAWAPPAMAKAKVEAIDATLAKGNISKGVAQAEAAVAAAPRDAALRAVLGRAYLRDGRFVSASAALNDALSLGDNSSRTMLALALAQIGSGQSREAVNTLDMGRNSIPAADLGLALALAGEGARGTTILGDALRAGDKSDKLRANLAYAYALDGRWAEARNLVALDLPADKVDARMTEWAKAAAPEASRERVANLLGVTMRADSGLPSHLALAPAAPEAPHLASAPMPAMAAPALAAAPEPAPTAELPPVAEPAPAPSVPTTLAAAPAPVFHAVQPVSSAPVKLAKHQPKAKPAPKADQVAAEPAAPVKSAPAKLAKLGNHQVQFGAFLSEKNAERAKRQALSRDKSLSASDVSIAKAEVGGKTFWRVAIAGLDANGATNKCQAIRKAGGSCFARNDIAPANSAPRALAMAGR